MVRIKERYLLVNIIYPPGAGKSSSASLPGFVALNQPTTDDLTPQTLGRGIRAQVTAIFGDFGAGVVSCQVKYLSNATSTFILKTHRTHYRLLWAALTLMDRVPVRNGGSCSFRVVRVSGTIRKVEEEAVRRAKLLILAAKDAAAQNQPSILGSQGLGSNPLAGTDTTMLDVVDSDLDVDGYQSDGG